MDNIRRLIRKLIEDTITEMTTTGGVAGYETPFAFSRKSLTPKLTKRTKKIPNQKKNGYKTIPQGDPNGPSSKSLRNESSGLTRQNETVDSAPAGNVRKTAGMYVSTNQTGDTQFFDLTPEGKVKALKFAKTNTRHPKITSDARVIRKKDTSRSKYNRKND